MEQEIVDLTQPGVFGDADLQAARILLASRQTTAEGTSFVPGRSGDALHETVFGLGCEAQSYLERRLGWK